MSASCDAVKLSRTGDRKCVASPAQRSGMFRVQNRTTLSDQTKTWSIYPRAVWCVPRMPSVAPREQRTLFLAVEIVALGGFVGMHRCSSLNDGFFGELWLFLVGRGAQDALCLSPEFAHSVPALRSRILESCLPVPLHRSVA